MSNVNEQLIQKTLETSDFFAGGQINPTQQAEFVRLVKDFAVMLGLVRFVDMPNRRYDVDKMHLGEPITSGADENTNNLTNLAKPKFNKITLNTKKVKTAYAITTESLQEAINQGDLETSVLEIVTKRFSTDIELMAIQGDDTIVGATPLDLLLKVMDGWAKQTEAAQIVDAAGANISKDIFAAMLRTMPQQYLQDPDLRWMLSRVINIDWMDTIADRETSLGDAAYRGEAPPILGIPSSIIPLIPSDLVCPVSTATAALVVGNQFGPFEIRAGVNDGVKIDLDNAGPVTFALTAGVLDTTEVARQINNAMGARIASDNDGRLQLKSTTTGAASEVDIQAVANDAYATLGLTVGVTTGADAGANTRPEGSFIWLGNPMNWVFGMLDATRVFSEFNKDYDRVEVVIYNEVDAQIENLSAIVKGINVRRKSL